MLKIDKKYNYILKKGTLKKEEAHKQISERKNANQIYLYNYSTKCDKRTEEKGKFVEFWVWIMPYYYLFGLVNNIITREIIN